MNESDYYNGQADVLGWLNGDIADDDDPFAPIHSELTTEYALWCIGFNLTMACALKLAERKGKEAAVGWNSRDEYSRQYYKPTLRFRY